MKRLSLVLALATAVCLLGISCGDVRQNETKTRVNIDVVGQGVTAKLVNIDVIDTVFTRGRGRVSTKVITVHPDTVRIKKAQEEVDWRCLKGNAEIRFVKVKGKGGTPFVSGVFQIAKGGGASSGPVRDDVIPSPEETYRYIVSVFIPGLDPSKQPEPVDPEVVVDP